MLLYFIQNLFISRSSIIMALSRTVLFFPILASVINSNMYSKFFRYVSMSLTFCRCSGRSSNSFSSMNAFRNDRNLYASSSLFIFLNSVRCSFRSSTSSAVSLGSCLSFNTSFIL